MFVAGLILFSCGTLRVYWCLRTRLPPLVLKEMSGRWCGRAERCSEFNGGFPADLASERARISWMHSRDWSALKNGSLKGGSLREAGLCSQFQMYAMRPLSASRPADIEVHIARLGPYCH